MQSATLARWDKQAAFHATFQLSLIQRPDAYDHLPSAHSRQTQRIPRNLSHSIHVALKEAGLLCRPQTSTTTSAELTNAQILPTFTLSFSFSPAAASSVMPDDVLYFVGDAGWLQEATEACSTPIKHYLSFAGLFE